jgi:hypothetical protein
MIQHVLDGQKMLRDDNRNISSCHGFYPTGPAHKVAAEPERVRAPQGKLRAGSAKQVAIIPQCMRQW